MRERRTYAYEKYERLHAAAARRKKRMAVLGVLITALAVLALVMFSQTFVLREILITGNSMRSDSEIAGLSGLRLGTNILSVDLEKVQKSFQNNSYIELIDVTIKLPDTVVLEVLERQACAAVNGAGVILLVDSEGYILNRYSTLPQLQNVLLVNGMDVAVSAQGKMLESSIVGQIRDMKRLLNAIYESGMENLISELNVSDQDNLYLISQSGVQVLLGDSQHLEEKLTWMRAVLEVLTKEGVMKGVLDVSTGTNAVYADR